MAFPFVPLAKPETRSAPVGRAREMLYKHALALMYMKAYGFDILIHRVHGAIWLETEWDSQKRSVQAGRNLERQEFQTLVTSGYLRLKRGDETSTFLRYGLSLTGDNRAIELFEENGPLVKEFLKDSTDCPETPTMSKHPAVLAVMPPPPKKDGTVALRRGVESSTFPTLSADLDRNEVGWYILKLNIEGEQLLKDVVAALGLSRDRINFEAPAPEDLIKEPPKPATKTCYYCKSEYVPVGKANNAMRDVCMERECKNAYQRDRRAAMKKLLSGDHE